MKNKINNLNTCEVTTCKWVMWVIWYIVWWDILHHRNSQTIIPGVLKYIHRSETSACCGIYALSVVKGQIPNAFPPDHGIAESYYHEVILYH